MNNNIEQKENLDGGGSTATTTYNGGTSNTATASYGDGGVCDCNNSDGYNKGEPENPTSNGGTTFVCSECGRTCDCVNMSVENNICQKCYEEFYTPPINKFPDPEPDPDGGTTFVCSECGRTCDCGNMSIEPGVCKYCYRPTPDIDEEDEDTTFFCTECEQTYDLSMMSEDPTMCKNCYAKSHAPTDDEENGGTTFVCSKCGRTCDCGNMSDEEGVCKECYVPGDYGDQSTVIPGPENTLPASVAVDVGDKIYLENYFTSDFSCGYDVIGINGDSVEKFGIRNDMLRATRPGISVATIEAINENNVAARKELTVTVRGVVVSEKDITIKSIIDGNGERGTTLRNCSYDVIVTTYGIDDAVTAASTTGATMVEVNGNVVRVTDVGEELKLHDVIEISCANYTTSVSVTISRSTSDHTGGTTFFCTECEQTCNCGNLSALEDVCCNCYKKLPKCPICNKLVKKADKYCEGCDFCKTCAEKITVSIVGANTLAVGEQITLNAIVTCDEEKVDVPVSWLSSATDVADVDNGTVMAYKEGTATITATVLGNVQGTLNMTITGPYEYLDAEKTIRLGEDVYIIACAGNGLPLSYPYCSKYLVAPIYSDAHVYNDVVMTEFPIFEQGIRVWKIEANASNDLYRIKHSTGRYLMPNDDNKTRLILREDDRYCYKISQYEGEDAEKFKDYLSSFSISYEDYTGSYVIGVNQITRPNEVVTSGGKYNLWRFSSVNDTNFNFGFDKYGYFGINEKLKLCDAGYKFAGQYLNAFSYDQEKRLFSNDSNTYCLKMYSIYERGMQMEENKTVYFAINNGESKGIDDAKAAILLAEKYLQPAGTPIYFAVEPSGSLTDTIKQATRSYYNGIISVLEDTSINPNHYQLGFYGVADLYKSLVECDETWEGILIKYYFFPGSSGSNYYVDYNQSHIYTIRQMDEIDLIYTSEKAENADWLKHHDRYRGFVGIDPNITYKTLDEIGAWSCDINKLEELMERET